MSSTRKENHKTLGTGTRPRDRLRSFFGLAALALLFAASCGGKSAPAAEPMAEPEEDEAPARSGDVLIPPEKIDEVQRFFDHKRQVMARCFGDAVDKGEAPKNEGGHVTISMTISTSGKLENVKITEMEPRSQILEQCVLDTARRWTVTSLPKPLDYSFTYGFGTL